VAKIKSIRHALPLERLIKVNGFVDDEKNDLDGIVESIAVALNSE